MICTRWLETLLITFVASATVSKSLCSINRISEISADETIHNVYFHQEEWNILFDINDLLNVEIPPFV